MSASWINKLNESDSRLHKENVLMQAREAATIGSANADRKSTRLNSSHT